jgi:hypothetical protein
MNINERGHLTMDGMPVTRPEEQAHYVGTRERFIAFAYCVLGDGRVVVHSTLIDVFDDTVEDFLYEVAERREAYETASTMVDDATAYLKECGALMDANRSAQDFLSKLRQQLTIGLH